MPSLAWQDVLREVNLHPWLEVDSQGVVDLDPENHDGALMRRHLDELEVALLDGKTTRFWYETCRRGIVDYMRGDCWLGTVVKERVSGLKLVQSLMGMIARLNLSDQLTVQTIGEHEHPGHEYLIIRFRYSSRTEFCLWCQILMSTLQEIPV